MLYYFVMNFKEKQIAYIEMNEENIIEAAQMCATPQDLKNLAHSLLAMADVCENEEEITQALIECDIIED
jgi:hypothetical protein